MERKILGVRLQDRIRNEDLRKRTNIKDATTLATHTKWKWAGLVMRMGQNRWAHKTTTGDPRTSHRNVGRPKRRWADDLKLHFGSNWTMKVKDWRQWKDLTASAKEDWRPAKSQTTRDGQNIHLTQKQQRLEKDPSRIGYVVPPDQPPCQPRGPCPQGYLHGLNLNCPIPSRGSKWSMYFS